MTWRLLYVRPAAERKVVAAICEMRDNFGLPLEAYTPIERVWRGLGGKRREHDRALLPSIVFARVADDQLPQVTHADGVHRLVLANMADTLSLMTFIGRLRGEEAEGLFDKTRKVNRKGYTLQAGERVRIARGRWAGIVAQIEGMTPDRRVKLVTDLFGRAGRMTIEADKLERIATAADPTDRQLVAA